MSGSHRTIAGPVEVELEKVKGSRFLCVLAPIDSAESARTVLDRVRAEHSDASHHCWAWRLGEGREQANDDGEPRDSAGAPILRHLVGADVVDVLAVVVRWFGGTKLGRGGLVRAYGDAAAAALAAATFVEHRPTARLVVTHGYDLTGAVDGVLHAQHATVLDEAYGSDVVRTVEVGAEQAEATVAALADATAGQAVVELGPAT